MSNDISNDMSNDNIEEFLKVGLAEKVIKHSILFNYLETALHCLTYCSQPVMTCTAENDLLVMHVVFRPDSCENYVIVDYRTPVLEKDVVIGEVCFFEVIYAAMIDVDNNITYKHPLIIQGPQIRVEIA